MISKLVGIFYSLIQNRKIKHKIQQTIYQFNFKYLIRHIKNIKFSQILEIAQLLDMSRKRKRQRKNTQNGTNVSSTYSFFNQRPQGIKNNTFPHQHDDANKYQDNNNEFLHHYRANVQKELNVLVGELSAKSVLPNEKRNNCKHDNFGFKNWQYQKTDRGNNRLQQRYTEQQSNQQSKNQDVPSFYCYPPSPTQSKNNITSLCCRTFFFENQQIKEPESETLQYKKYQLPFSRIHHQQIKKTICAFLNHKGGIIFLGIQENLTTKQHTVKGDFINERQKQEFLKIMRQNVIAIEPDILINHKMRIFFVPVKSSQYPFRFLEGRFVIKITIEQGIRDEIYTYKNDDGEGFMPIRTENEVLTYNFKRDFRKILFAQKERAQTPLGKPRKMHKADQTQCMKPEEGCRVFSQTNRFSKYIKKRDKKEKEDDKGVQQDHKDKDKDKDLEALSDFSFGPISDKKDKNVSFSLNSCHIFAQNQEKNKDKDREEKDIQIIKKVKKPQIVNKLSHNIPQKEKKKQMESPILKSYQILKKLKNITHNDHLIYILNSQERQNIKEIIESVLPPQKFIHKWGFLGSTLMIWQFDPFVDELEIDQIQFNIKKEKNKKKENKCEDAATDTIDKIFCKLSIKLKIILQQCQNDEIVVKKKSIVQKYDGKLITDDNFIENSPIQISSSSEKIGQDSKNSQKGANQYVKTDNRKSKKEISQIKKPIDLQKGSEYFSDIQMALMKLSKYCAPLNCRKQQLWEFRNLQLSLGAYIAIRKFNIEVMFYQ